MDRSRASRQPSEATSIAGLALRPAIEYGLGELAGLLNRSFEKYFVTISVSTGGFAAMLRLDGIDLNTSRVITKDGEAVGCVLLAHRGWTTRVAAMGLAANARGSGIGRWAMDEIMAEAKERGDRVLVLEVIEQNQVAVRLYRNCGFTAERRLVGFRAEKPEGALADGLVEVDVRQIARVLSSAAPPDLPWQASAATLAQMGRPASGFQLGPAYAALSDPNQAQIAIRSLALAEPDRMRRGHGSRLLRALFAKFPEKTWSVSIIWPEEIAPGFFERLGFEKLELSQIQMRLAL